MDIQMSNNLRVIKNLIYTLEQQYGVKVKIGQYKVGEIDYSKPTASTSSEEHTVKVIPLPLNIARSFVKQAKVSFETYDTMYIVKPSAVPFPLKPGNYIIANGLRYNIQKIEMIETYCYLVGANSALGETHE